MSKHLKGPKITLEGLVFFFFLPTQLYLNNFSKDNDVVLF